MITVAASCFWIVLFGDSTFMFKDLGGVGPGMVLAGHPNEQVLSIRISQLSRAEYIDRLGNSSTDIYKGPCVVTTRSGRSVASYHTFSLTLDCAKDRTTVHL